MCGQAVHRLEARRRAALARAEGGRKKEATKYDSMDDFLASDDDEQPTGKKKKAAPKKAAAPKKTKKQAQMDDAYASFVEVESEAITQEREDGEEEPFTAAEMEEYLNDLWADLSGLHPSHQFVRQQIPTA